MSSPPTPKAKRHNLASETYSRPTLLLDWYDLHRRRLPWRPLPGESADPYRAWLSEIMLQQTGVKAVTPYFLKFLARWPDVDALGRASLVDVLRMWAGLGYYSRACNLHACAVAVRRDHGGAFPDSEQRLRALAGLGPYTAEGMAGIAFGARRCVRQRALRCCPVADPRRKGPARRHDGSAYLALARRAGRQGGAGAGASIKGHRPLAPQARYRHPCLHPFSVGACGLYGKHSQARPRANGHALGFNRDAKRRRAAQCDEKCDR